MWNFCAKDNFSLVQAKLSEGLPLNANLKIKYQNDCSIILQSCTVGQPQTNCNISHYFTPIAFYGFIEFTVISQLRYYLEQNLIYHLKALTKRNLLVLTLSSQDNMLMSYSQIYSSRLQQIPLYLVHMTTQMFQFH